VAPISLSLDSTESGVTSNKWSVNSNHRKVLSYHKDPRFIILSAIDNVKPLLEVRKIRIAGRTRFVPGTVKTLRQQSLAVR
jgi:ribosomal protein S7